MNWFKGSQKKWVHGMKQDMMDFEFYIASAEDKLHGVFVILPHYTSKFKIKSYSVWYQNDTLRKNGGDNFAMRIKQCNSFFEGQKIAEATLEDFKNNEPLDNVRSEYIGDDTHMEGPFCLS